jgi:hypothetical protein
MSIIGNATLDGESFGMEWGLNDQGIREGTFTAVWQVLFDENDDPMNRPMLAIDAPGIPRFFDPHPGNEWFFVTGIKPNQIAPLLYEVVVTYVSNDNPLDFNINPPMIKWIEEDTEEPTDIDVNGNAIANAAGQPFDPPISTTFADTVLTIQVVRPFFNVVLATEYHNAVNSDIFWGAEPGSVKARKIEGDPFRGSTGRWYFMHNYEFVFRDDHILTNGEKANWKRRIKNEGLMCFDSGPIIVGERNLVKCKDSEGEPVNEPVALTTDGQQVADGVDPNWLLFQTRPSLPFLTGFGLQDVFDYWAGINP